MSRRQNRRDAVRSRKRKKGGFMKLQLPSTLIFGLGIGLLGISPAMAHHSFAMFDLGTDKIITGTIKEFQWTNPHTVIWVYVPDGKGGQEIWAIESLSTGNLIRRGWDKHSLKPG